MFRDEELKENDPIHEILKADAADIKLPEDFLEKSFERLQTKMRFAKNTAVTDNKKNNILKWTVSVAACAACFLAVFIPLSGGSSINSVNSITPIASTSLKPIAKNNIIVDGGIKAENLSVAVKDAGESNADGESEFNDSIMNSTVIPAMNINLDETLASIDVFKDRVNVGQNYDFPVTVSGTHTVKNNGGGISMPGNHIFGR